MVIRGLGPEPRPCVTVGLDSPDLPPTVTLAPICALLCGKEFDMDIGTLTRVERSDEHDRLVAADPAKLKTAITTLRRVARANAEVVRRLVESATLEGTSRQDKTDAVKMASLLAQMTANTLADPDLTEVARLRRAATQVNDIVEIADRLMGPAQRSDQR